MSSASNAVFTLSPVSQFIQIGKPFNVSWSFSGPPGPTVPVDGFFLTWLSFSVAIFPEPGQTNGTFTWGGDMPPNDASHLEVGDNWVILAETGNP
jgi:hypothetical protein